MVEIDDDPNDNPMMNPDFHPALQDRRHPYLDVLEPEATPDEIRAARVTAIALISSFAAGIANSLADPKATLQSVATAFWSRALALGLPCCEGTSVSQLALSLGIQRATLSKAMVEFAAAHQLPASPWMKAEASRKAYAQARVDSIRRSNGKANGEVKLPAPPRHRSV